MLSKAPVYSLIAAAAGLFLLLLFFILRDKSFKKIYILASYNLILLCALPFIHEAVEPYASSRNACEYLLQNYKVDNAILCSKPFVRGVRYYTDKPVAVTAAYSKNFFSPHPVPFFDSDEKTKDFLYKQRTTYCITTKNSLEDLSRIKGVDIAVLNKIGKTYILRITVI